jgi:hypothetical protein
MVRVSFGVLFMRTAFKTINQSLNQSITKPPPLFIDELTNTPSAINMHKKRIILNNDK